MMMTMTMTITITTVTRGCAELSMGPMGQRADKYA
jgi:hypothetical protein